MNLFETTILRTSCVARDSALAKTVMTRDNIVEMTQTAEDAVMRPRNFGVFGHDLRAALAARVANLGADETLAKHYLEDAGDYALLADPAERGAAQDLSAVLAFVDKVANQTRDIEAADISGLQEAGISDADIVRLCELVAFLAYQIRVIAGLRLMQGAAS